MTSPASPTSQFCARDANPALQMEDCVKFRVSEVDMSNVTQSEEKVHSRPSVNLNVSFQQTSSKMLSHVNAW